MAKLAVPAGLGTKARKVWTGTVESFELRPDELRVLEDACREIDLVEVLEKELGKASTQLLVKGSMGQPVANPLMQEIRQHRQVIARLLQSLKLPAEDESAAQPRSVSARQAADARWKMGG